VSACEKAAWLFPGQGVELTGIRAFLDASSAVRARMDAAAALVDADLAALCRRGDPRLFEGQLLQPAVTALSLGIVDELVARGAAPSACAGHSLGELAALVASRALEADAALFVAAARGERMGRAARARKGGMLALNVTDPNVVDRALATGAEAGTIVLATHNTPNEWVLAGDDAALSLVMARFPSVRLRVEGAFHSPLMQPALEGYRAALERVQFAAPSAGFVSGETGDFVVRAEAMRGVLVAQLTRTLDWTRVLRRLRSWGVQRFVSVGPGKAQRSFVHQCLGRSVEVLSTDTPLDLENSVKELLN
jgi:[acyl-carrier-protein] S-malonyltransferase